MKRASMIARLKTRRDRLDDNLRRAGKDQEAKDRFSAARKRIDSAIKTAEDGSWLHPDD